MSINLQIRNFIEDLITTINNNPLPIEIKRLALYVIYTETQRAADTQISGEKAQEQAEQETNDDLTDTVEFPIPSETE
jgi:hypothetical protein